ncbi:hypothetical protein ACFE04_013026 [Oxalis oulophora]
MDSDGGATTSSHAHTTTVVTTNKAIYLFQQQQLPACRPVLSPPCVIFTFLLVALFFVPAGFILLRASHHVPKFMKAPIYVYYQLDNYYQNHRRYVKSRSDQQLLHGLKYKDTSSCQPEESVNGFPIVPCGLVSWSLFNDTFTFSRGMNELSIDRKNIAWNSDRDHKFGKNVYPYNFQNGTFIGGGKLDPNMPLSDQEDLIVWMRTAALPSFRKLYGRIEEDLDADDIIKGGKNDFLGLAYMFVGSSALIVSVVFTVLHARHKKR